MVRSLIKGKKTFEPHQAANTMKEELNKDGYEENVNVFEKLVANLKLENNKTIVNTWVF
jgi:hypothetical protein